MVSQPKPTPDWIARIVGVGGIIIAAAAFILQFSERSTPFNVELYVAKIASYREVTRVSRELAHDLPGYLLWPDRQNEESRKKLVEFRNIIESNSMMWNKPIALKLEELAHLSDLALLSLDGVIESHPKDGLYILSKEKVKGGSSLEHQKILNDFFAAAIDSAGWMRQELDRERGKAERAN